MLFLAVLDAKIREFKANSKIKWDSGNPTGHGIIFIGHGLEIH
jgi:hypothetical protein